MKRTTLYQLLLAGAMICTLLVAPFGLELWSEGNSNDGGIRLAAPSFVKQANAAPGAAAKLQSIAGEAGFSAYFRTESEISLDDVEGLYQILEDRTDNYTIGTIELVDYGEGEAPHLYINTDGWVMVYYPAFYTDGTEIPLSRSIDIVNYDGIEFNTKLKSALNKVFPAVGVPASTPITYYHFLYPNATHLTILGETTCSRCIATFQAKTPGSFTYHNVGWAFSPNNGWNSDISINGVELASSSYRYGSVDSKRIYDVTVENAQIGITLLYDKGQ